jgi:hypothetical protein
MDRPLSNRIIGSARLPLRVANDEILKNLASKMKRFAAEIH